MTSPESADQPTPPPPAEPPAEPPAPEPAATPPARRRVPAPLVIGLIIGLVVGGGGVALAWILAGGSPEGAEADAQAVCGVIERTETPTTPESVTLDNAQRWAAASALADSVAERDGRYRPLQEAMTEVRGQLQIFDLPKAGEAIGKARGICADL